MASLPADARPETENEAWIGPSDELFPALPQFKVLTDRDQWLHYHNVLTNNLAILTHLRSMITPSVHPTPQHLATVHSAFVTLQSNLTIVSNNVSVSASGNGGFGVAGIAAAGNGHGTAGGIVAAGAGSMPGAVGVQAAGQVSVTTTHQSGVHQTSAVTISGSGTGPHTPASTDSLVAPQCSSSHLSGED